MKQLISMTDFVLNPPKSEPFKIGGDKYIMAKHSELCTLYARFLKQPLKLEMFVPCVDGVTIEEPKEFEHYETMRYIDEKSDGWIEECYQYQQAKEKVLFQGLSIFEINRLKHICDEDIDVEFYASITNVTKPTLTPNALKQIGL